MELSEAIAKFKADLAGIKQDGVSQLDIENIVKYLDQLEAQAALSVEQRRMKHESDLAQYKAQSDLQVANFNAVLAAGKEAINASIIINGGAVIALMAFMGNVVSKASNIHYVALLANSLMFFGVGTLCGGVAFGTRYISQFLYGHYPNKNALMAGHIVNGLSWLVTLSAFLSFAWAVYLTRESLAAIR